MKRLDLYIFISLAFILSFGIIYSCKKEKNKITINGAVHDPNIQAYVSGATVTIASSKITNGYYNSNYSTIATTTTDANGGFTFEFEKEKSAGYRMTVSKANYFEFSEDIADDNIVPGTPYTPQYEIYPLAFIKLHVKNTNPHDSTDFIAYSYTSGYLSCYECCSNTTYKGYGEFYEATTKCKTQGSHSTIVSWHVTKNSSDISYSDTIFCTPFDTTSYEILY